jgi:hypothetical protein
VALELIDAVSAPGHPTRPNDDAYCHAGRIAAVFDGATGLGEPLLPGDSDAAWLARLGAERLATHAARLDAQAALRAAAHDVELAYERLRTRPPVERYEIPVASMMLVEARAGEGLDALWFGDCAALVLGPDQACQVVGEAFDKRLAEAAAATRLAAEHGISPARASVDAAFLPALRAARSRYNTEGGAWVFGPTRDCADKAKRGSVRAPPGSLVLLASDGFLALGTDYGRYDAAGLVAAARDRGLADLLDELRSVERNDPEGLAYPRFKTSDDATAVFLRVL